MLYALIMSFSKPFFLLLILFDVSFIRPKKMLWLFKMFLAESNLAFLFLRLMNGLHLFICFREVFS